jgi:tRNA(adenine34) deaminase
MCAFMARELKFGRIVYAVSSPVCGGHKRWKILKDVELLKLEPFYDAPPEVIGGVLKTEALALMRKIGWHHYFT